MGFVDRKERTYFKIKEGKVLVWNGQGEDEHAGFKGTLKSIVYAEREAEFNGKKQEIKSYDVLFEDEEGKEYMWSAKHSSSLFNNFINALCSLDEYSGELFLRPYIKDKKLRLYMEYNGSRLDWKYKIDEMPALEPLMIKGKQAVDKDGNPMWDMTDRLDWVKERVAEINAKIKRPKITTADEDDDNDAEIDEIFGGAQKA